MTDEYFFRNIYGFRCNNLGKFWPILIKIFIGNPCNNTAQACKNCHDISTFLNLLRHEFVAIYSTTESI